jgi:uncharacterized protein (TIGR02117 family)
MLISLASAFLRIILPTLVFLLLTYAGPARAANEWTCSPEEKLCRTVFIVHDSWHAAIVLRKDDVSTATLPELADFPDARFVEFSWGDKDYFPDPDSGFSMALKAAFWSSGSVLHLVGFNDDLRKAYPKAETIELRLLPANFDRLLGFLSQSFLRHDSKGGAQPSSGLYSYSRFYPSTRKFSLINTCNTWVAQTLETAGLPVSASRVITAGQLAEQIERIRGLR